MTENVEDINKEKLHYEHDDNAYEDFLKSIKNEPTKEIPEKTILIEKDGLINVRGYVVWTKVDIVKQYIISYLKNIFPNSLIVPEFNKIDLLVLDEGIPVEIQTTVLAVRSTGMYSSMFEDKIRRQIEDNIENYEICWFFFDSEYYRYLNETTNTQISLNMDWFAKYVKDNKLKVFTSTYDGIIKELKYEDLEFIRRISNTCKLEYNDDERVLNRNKLKILKNVLNGYSFSQHEVDKFVNDYNKREVRDTDIRAFLMKETDNRKKLYGNVLNSMGTLPGINDFLNMNKDYKETIKSSCAVLGIVKVDYGGNQYSNRTEFRDEFNICQYFPGYTRNIEIWNSLKNHPLKNNVLRDIIVNKDNKSQSKLIF